MFIRYDVSSVGCAKSDDKSPEFGREHASETKHLAKRHEKRNKGDVIHQEKDGEDGHGHKTVAFLGRWFMLPASKQP